MSRRILAALAVLVLLAGACGDDDDSIDGGDGDAPADVAPDGGNDAEGAPGGDVDYPNIGGLGAAAHDHVGDPSITGEIVVS